MIIQMRKFLREFKEFAVKGSVVDLAVGVIIGGAFGKIVTSLVNDIIMPLIGLIIGKVNFSDLKWVISKSDGKSPALSLNYGSFIQSVVDFSIIALSIFLFIKLINKVKAKFEKEKAADEEKKLTQTEQLLTEIRDLLKEEKNK